MTDTKATLKSLASLDGLHMSGLEGAIRTQRGLASTAHDGVRTPLFDGVDPRHVSNLLADLLSTSSGSSQRLLELEQNESEKVGPYYHRPFTEWWQKLDAYFGQAKAEFSVDRSDDGILEDAFTQVVSRLLDQLGGQPIEPITLEEAVSRARRNTNLGLPLFTSQWDETKLRDYIRRADKLSTGGEVKLYPFVLFRRVQPGGYYEGQEYPSKNRPVWGSDHADTFAGLRYLLPLLDTFRASPEWAHLTNVDRLEEVVQYQSRRYKYKLGLDLSALDTTFGPTLMLIGIRVMRELINCPDSYLERLFYHYSQGEIIAPSPDGRDVKVWTGVHGFPSGCVFTNLWEIFGLLVIAQVALLQQGISDAVLLQNGDDGAYFTNTEIDIDVMEQTYSTYGLVFNKNKTSRADDYVVYLQRHFFAEHDYTAIMSTQRMLGRIMYAERFLNLGQLGIRPRDYWTITTLQKLENCNRHPNFAEFVDLVRGGDEYGLTVTPRVVAGARTIGQDNPHGFIAEIEGSRVQEELSRE